MSKSKGQGHSVPFEFKSRFNAKTRLIVTTQTYKCASCDDFPTLRQNGKVEIGEMEVEDANSFIDAIFSDGTRKIETERRYKRKADEYRDEKTAIMHRTHGGLQ